MATNRKFAKARPALSGAESNGPPSHEHVLVVEDEPDLQDLLRYNLEREGYTVTVAGRGEEGLALAEAHRPDVVLLDLMLPGIDGLAVCRTLRNEASMKNMAIVMLTAKGEESDIVAGLELGADDYITKPFSPRVLMARLKAVIRRRSDRQVQGESAVLRVGELAIDLPRFEVRVSGEPVALTLTEFGIVRTLARRRGQVYTRNQIVEAVQGTRVAVTDRSVDVHVVSLRRKLGSAGRYLQTVRGVGYRLEEC